MKWQAVAINTFKEAIRDKILYNLLIFGLILIGGSTLLATLTTGEQFKIIMDFGLASIRLFGTLIAILLGVGLVSKEIEKRTLYIVLAKPIGRSEFLFGKYAGLLLTLGVNTVIMGVGLYLTLMLNRFRWGLPVWDLEPRLIDAIALTYLELALLTAVALLFSTFTTTTLATIFTLSIFVIGHLSGDLMTMGAKLEVQSTVVLLKGIYYTLPNLSYFNIRAQVVHNIPVASAYLFFVFCYALLYTTLLMGIATFIFKRRDLK